MASITHSLLLLSLLLLTTAALHDLVTRTVPNRLAAALATLGFGVQVLQGAVLMAALAALAVFALAALCWQRGWMGGGDVKLLGAAALLVPPSSVPAMIAAITMAGLPLAVIYLLCRHRVTLSRGLAPPGLLARIARIERRRLRRGGPLPYAVAIASGVAFIIATEGLLP